jgi:hypothetical protein
MSTVWVSPSATVFSCLCEPCLEQARTSGTLFSDALAGASVRGTMAREIALIVVRCQAGHEIVLRRTLRPETLPHRDERQLQLA